MQALTREMLAGNAYRTLGLAAAAGQKAVDSAARRMRIWPDAQSIPSTPWDLPWLGPINRNRKELEQAVARLNQPASRLRERLLWYHAPAGEAPGEVRTPAEGAMWRHNAALVLLHAATVANADEVRPWRKAVDELAAVWTSPDTQLWLRASDDAGGFEKRVTEDEVQAAVQALPRALAEALVLHVMDTVERKAWGTVDGLVKVVATPALVAAAPAALPSLANRLEDQLDAAVTGLDKELRDILRTNKDNPESFYTANRDVTVKAHATYTREIEPLLERVCATSSLMNGDGDRVIRVNGRCGALMSLIALGWEWCGAPVTAEKALEQALGMARGTQHEPGIAADLRRVKELADQWRRTHEEWATAGATASSPLQSSATPNWTSPTLQIRNPAKAKRPLGCAVWAVLFVSGIVTRLVSDNGHSSSRYPSTPTIPNFPRVEVPKMDQESWERFMKMNTPEPATQPSEP